MSEREPFVHYTPKAPNSTIWTQSLSDCVAVATFDVATNARTLIHLPGMQVSQGYFDGVAKDLSTGSTVIVGAGQYCSQNYLGSWTEMYIIEGFETAMKNHGRSLMQHTNRHLRYETYWANDLEINEWNTSFAVQADGQYGSVLPAQQAASQSQGSSSNTSSSFRGSVSHAAGKIPFIGHRR